MSVFLRGITSKHDGNFYCLNCFHSFKTQNKLESQKNFVVLPSEDIKILEFNQ